MDIYIVLSGHLRNARYCLELLQDEFLSNGDAGRLRPTMEVYKDLLIVERKVKDISVMFGEKL